MKALKLIVIFFFWFSTNSLYSQSPLTLNEYPKRMQLYPRNLSSNQARINFSGVLNNAYYSGIKILVFKDDSLIRTFTRNLTATQSFTSIQTLNAGKFRYKFELYLMKGQTDSLFYTADDILVGDAFLITGQSNAVAGDHYNTGLANANYSDSFIRSFGNVADAGDSNWYIADGDTVYEPGSVGQWGMVMAKTNLDKYGIPVAIINGGIGARSITFFQRNDANPTDVNTNYGQTLNRLKRARLHDKLCAILFYQGENDGGDAELHDTLFKALYRDWLRDYSGMVKNFVVQVRAGCGDPTLDMRERQRQFEFNLPGIKVMTVNGLNGHDGCHFTFTDGYEELGLNMAPFIAREIFKDTLRHIDPINIKYAWFSNADQTEITLELHNPPTDSFRADSGFYEYFSINGSNVRVVGGKIRNNRIVLNLSHQACETSGLNYEGAWYSGNWVTTLRGVGMLSFYNAKIYKSAPLNDYKACYMQELEIENDSASGYTYQWNDLNSNWTSAMAKPVFVPDTSTVLRLITRSNNSSCMYDTVYTAIECDMSRATFLGQLMEACYYDSVEINKPADFISWDVTGLNGNTGAGQIFFAKPGKYKIEALSLKNCIIHDSFHIALHYNPLELSRDTTICSYDSVLLQAANGHITYKWNNISYNSNNFKAAAGTITFFESKDSFDCIYYDTLHTGSIKPVKPDLGADRTICPGDRTIITLPATHKILQWNGIPDSLPAYTTGSIGNVHVSAADSASCIASDTLIIKHYPLPLKPDLGADTGLCTNDSFVISVPSDRKVVSWNGNPSTAQTYTVITEPELIVMCIDSNLCHSSDTVQISHFNLPYFSLGNDSTFCADKTLTLGGIAVPGYQYLWQDSTGNSEFVAAEAGTYTLKVISQDGCHYSDTIKISTFSLPSGFLRSDTTICIGDSLLISSKSDYVSYQWSNGGINKETILHLAGKYRLVVKDLNGCEGSDSFELFTEKCDNSVSKMKLNSVHVSPNPADDVITVYPVISGSLISISDISGKLLLQYRTIESGRFIIDCSMLSDGIYILMIDGNPLRIVID